MKGGKKAPAKQRASVGRGSVEEFKNRIPDFDLIELPADRITKAEYLNIDSNIKKYEKFLKEEVKKRLELTQAKIRSSQRHIKRMLDEEDAARKEQKQKETKDLLRESIAEKKEDEEAKNAKKQRPEERKELYEDLIKDPVKVSALKSDGFLSIDEKLSLFFQVLLVNKFQEVKTHLDHQNDLDNLPFDHFDAEKEEMLRDLRDEQQDGILSIERATRKRGVLRGNPSKRQKE